MRRGISLLLGVTLASVAVIGPVARAQDDGTGAMGAEWLVMLYQNADDEVLEGDIVNDLNEAELVGSTDAVTIVSQVDRFDGGYDGDGDWTTTKRFLVGQDDDLEAIWSPEIEDLGEVDSGAPETLVDFAVWAMTTFPAQHYALILSDHGAGWLGGWTDNAPNEGSMLSVSEIDTALGEILAQTGVAQLDLVGFDACLMAGLELLAGIAPHAAYAVASQEVEPAMGWAYAQIFDALASDPGMSGAELATTVVDSYIVGDATVLDPERRAAFVARTFGVQDEVSADEVIAAVSQPATLTALDLSGTQALLDAVDGLAIALEDAGPEVMERARTYAQAFDTVFGASMPSPYLDLGSFAHLAAELAGMPEMDAAVAGVDEAMATMVLAEVHGPGRPGATGISIFVPVPDLLWIVGLSASSISYTADATRFAAASLWDDYLASTLFGVPPEQGSFTGFVDPAMRDADLSAWTVPLLEREGSPVLDAAGVAAEQPVEASSVTVAPLGVSAEEVPAGSSVTLSTQITGDDVGYLYIEVSRFDEESGTYLLEDRDFVAADDTQDLNGVEYPVWDPADLAAFDFDWQPTVYGLSDGTTETIALLEPTVYSTSADDLAYEVAGTYTFADSGETRYARLTFDGNLAYRGMVAFTGPDGTGAARAFQPRAGDLFTVHAQRYIQEEDGSWSIIEEPGDTLAFGDVPLTVTPYDSYPGEYSVGIIASDLQDRTSAEFVTVHVTE